MNPNPKNVATRHIAAEKQAMAVVLRDVAQHNWGWFSREDPRMHLQTVDTGALEGPRKIRIWLEDRGKRTFEISTGKLDSKGVKSLHAEVRAARISIEMNWTQFMVVNRWLTVEISGSVVTLIAYPGLHHTYQVSIDLRHEFPAHYSRGQSGENKTWDDKLIYAEIDPDNGLLTVGPQKDRDTRPCLETWKFLFHD